MASERAQALRAESDRLLSGVAPAPEPPPQAAPTRALLPGEELLTAEDWSVIEHEPGFRQEMTRRSIVEDRKREAAARARQTAQADGVQAAADRAVRKWLRGFTAKHGPIMCGMTLNQLLGGLGRKVRKELAVRDDRIAELERRVAELEAKSRGGGA